MVLVFVTGSLSLLGALMCLGAALAARRRNARLRLLWLGPLSVGSFCLALSDAAIAWRSYGGPAWLAIPLPILSAFGALFLFGGLIRLKRHRAPSNRSPR